MKWTIASALIVVLSFNYCTTKKLPSFINRCKLADPTAEVSKCIVENALNLIPRLQNPIPELKLPAIEPLRVPKLEIDSGDAGPNKFSLGFNDIEVYGVKDTIVKEFIFDAEKPYLSLHVYIPQLYCKAFYHINGKLLLLELNSKGAAYLNISDVETRTHHRKASIVTRNGKRYLHLAEDEIEFVNYKKGAIQLEDIFKDNQALTEQTNKVLNDNFDDVSKEINPLIFESVRLLLLGIVKPLFDEYSLDELFI